MPSYKGNIITVTTISTAGTKNGTASGRWSLTDVLQLRANSAWPLVATVPGAPTIGTAVGVNTTSISVPFTAPGDTGGLPITSYTVTSSGGQTATGASSPIVVTGLTNGTSYTFTVTATNAVGTSISSGSSNSTQPIAPYFSSVALLLTGENFTDYSNNHYTVTNNGSTPLSTSVKKFNASSYDFSSTGRYLTIPNIGALGTANFTMELWIYRTGLGLRDKFILDQSNGSTFLFRWGGGTHLQFYINTGSTVIGILDYPFAFPLTTWYHLAVVRYGNVFTLFVNGISVATNSSAAAFTTSTANVAICANGTDGGENFQGHMADIRITKGYAIYTSNFSPGPTAALPTS
jgi:hypothetical protein